MLSLPQPETNRLLTYCEAKLISAALAYEFAILLNQKYREIKETIYNKNVTCYTYEIP